MELIELDQQDRERYNHFVSSQASGSFLQSWEWGEWQVRLRRTVSRFKLIDDSGNWLDSLQLIKMPLPFGRYYLYAPYGSVLDLRFKIEDLRFVIQALRQKFPRAIFIRLEPKWILDLRSWNLPFVKTANIQPAKTLIIDLSKSESELLTEMHHKTRYNIKLAQKHGVEIKEELEISIGHGLYFQETIDLICQTAARQGFITYAKEYYENLADFFALNGRGGVKAHIYKAIFKNQLLAAAIMVDFGKTRTFLFGGSSEFHKNVMAPYILHWQAMLDAKSAGFECYDFWGIETASGQTPGFARFKLGFGGREQEYGGAFDCIQHSLWYKSYQIFRFFNKFTKKISR